MIARKRIYWIVGVIALLAVAAIGSAVAASGTSAQGSPGAIDDGAELLDQASITLEQAIAAAQSAAEGALGEVDLEMYQGKLVFNVDVGVQDVKVDASDGAVLGFEADDENDKDGD